MTIQWEGWDPAVFAARRARLAQVLGELPALVAAGLPRPRNYPANTYPFRAESHFLYLFGLPLAGAVGLVEGDRATLFVVPPEPDAALWHGQIPSLAELATRTGLSVRPLPELAAHLAGRTVGRLPLPDPLTDADARLADAMVTLRLRHDAAALASMRRAAQATVAAFAAGRAATRPGVLEAEVCASMEAEIARRGMTQAYGSIVTVHGEILHNEAHHHTIGATDLLLCDVGAEGPDGWASDVTRTWPAGTAPSATQKAIYEIVLRAQLTAIDLVRPGTRYRDVHLAACNVIAEGLVGVGLLRGDPAELVADGVHALFFPHGIGHLLGLDVHDMEDLGDRAGYAAGRSRSKQFGLSYLRCDRDLEPGMSVTIEPGIYFVPAILDDPDLGRIAGDRLVRSALGKFADVRGIRIEDDVVVTAGAPEVLTAAIPK